MLSQGVEYFMLQNSEDPDPPDLEFFDYPGYMVQCRYEELGEELPEELLEEPELLPEDFTGALAAALSGRRGR